MENNGSSDEELPWVKFGNALPEIDETMKQPTSAKIHEQIVTDEEGRRRFHGAFTGGFSAGYYNTAGSKGGWAPTSFKSSRGEKSARSQLQPEDFMDDEDKSEHGIAPHGVRTQQEFATRKRSSLEEKKIGVREERMTFALGLEVIDAVLVPTRTDIGARLLRKLGWKEGQGVGPRVAGEEVRVPPGGSSGQGEPRFAPRDSTPAPLTPKSDLHGIGYSGIVPGNPLTGGRSRALRLRTKSGGKLSFQGQAFGVGAYEEEDEDIYSQEAMSNYDVIMGAENPDFSHGWTKPLALSGDKHNEAIELKAGALGGYHPARKSKSRRKIYPPPLLPPNFDPLRRLKLLEAVKNIAGKGLALKGDEILVQNPARPTIEDKARKMGKKFSVFDLISAEDKLRLERARLPKELGSNQSENKAEEPPKAPEPPKKVDPKLMRPFANNPEKQRRFEEFEKAKNKNKGGQPARSVERDGLTEWERRREEEEFGRVREIYSGFSGDIRARFTKALGEAAEQSTTSASVFGTVTRSKEEWHPDPLLCKRFNTPDPFPKSEVVGLLRKKQSGKMSIFNFPKLQTVTPPTEDSTMTSQSKDKESSMTSQEEVEPQVHEKVERPPMELFKSIFESGESSSEEEGVGGVGEVEAPARINAAEVFTRPINRNEPLMREKPTKHVFQPKLQREKVTTLNDFEQTEIKHVFNKPKKKNETQKVPPDVTTATTPPSVGTATAGEEFFGPPPPPTPSRHHEINKEEKKLNKSHKKQKKHKKKKNKKKND